MKYSKGPNYDSRTYDLAVYFLYDNPNFTDDQHDELATLIQRTIEDWIESNPAGGSLNLKGTT